MSISDDFTQAEFAAKHISSKSPIKPIVAIVLGSGLGGFADEMTEAVRISYNDIPHFARSTAVGHAGQLVMGNIGECPVVVMQGRVHLYEGYPVRSVVFPMRVFSRMGVRAAILTNAAGGSTRSTGRADWWQSAITSTCKGRIRWWDRKIRTLGCDLSI
jgi:purine-nucleoside phosphorylase